MHTAHAQCDMYRDEITPQHNKRDTHATIQCTGNTLQGVLTTAGDLKEVVHCTLFENASLELNKLVGDHYGQKCLIVGIDGHIECGCLEQNNYAMQN